eukprot:CAMPEP_0171380644 /NCGR_PEP_ID=MMETSP0879-20121228/29799_1 /TAXON_ID=67004 /ORGANISM="Thalassiosira weissflogii, Strain CCMP1336" /LENGTH=58 /DNA_ID=CAMNT_0011891829 /DNA_START=23 /DNA_END=195 /DNA_ORIENTATION=+
MIGGGGAVGDGDGAVDDSGDSGVDGGNKTYGENVFLNGNFKGEVLFLYAVPLVLLNLG